MYWQAIVYVFILLLFYFEKTFGIIIVMPLNHFSGVYYIVGQID